VIHPTIHLNGTSKESLVDGWNDAYAALQAAYTALQHTAPNGRDYYPQGPDAIQTATTEHRMRLLKIECVLEDLDALREVAMFPCDLPRS
jgi:hypothetical protein